MFVKISIFTKKNSFLTCFRSKNSGKFTPPQHPGPPKSPQGIFRSWRLQCAFSLWLWDSEKRLWMGVSVFEGQNQQFEWRWICSYCKFSPCELKKMVGVFAQSLRVRCRAQAAYQRHWRRQLLRMPWVIVMDLDALQIFDLKQLRKLNFWENWDFYKLFTFDILSERPCRASPTRSTSCSNIISSPGLHTLGPSGW